MELFVVVTHDMLDGFMVSGPFEGYGAALAWAERDLEGEWSVVRLEPVEFPADDTGEGA